MSKPSSRPPRGQSQKVASTWDGFVEQETGNGLTRERIISAAIAMADELGLAAVSIRNVAARLDSSAMALYHYFPSKRDLLNLMLDATYSEFERPAETVPEWRDALSHFAWESRRCLKRHPWVSVLRLGEPEYGPGCIRTLEALLTTLSRFGLDVRNAIRVLGVLFVFVNGFVAAENGNRRPPHSPGRPQSTGKQPTFSRPVLATGKYPNVSQFVKTGSELPNDEMFERALKWVLNGMAPDIEACMQDAGRASAKPPASNSKNSNRSSVRQL